MLMAAYFFWRWSERPGWRYCLLSAAAFSCAVLSKFSALLFLPPLALLYFAAARWKRAAELDATALWTGARRAIVFGLLSVAFSSSAGRRRSRCGVVAQATHFSFRRGTAVPFVTLIHASQR